MHIIINICIDIMRFLIAHDGRPPCSAPSPVSSAPCAPSARSGASVRAAGTPRKDPAAAAARWHPPGVAGLGFLHLAETGLTVDGFDQSPHP